MRICLALFCLSFHLVAAAQAALIIENVNIVSPHLSEPQFEMNVLVEDGEIKAISRTTIDVDGDVPSVSAQGMYLVPGIMDSHVHVSSVPGMGFGVEPVSRENPKLVEKYYQQQPRSFLYYGVTQVLDPNPGVHWQEFTAANAHPDYFRCEVITSKSTFPLVEKIDEASKVMFEYLVDEGTTTGAPGSPEDIVQAIHASGALCVKLYFEDGYGNASHWPLLSEETLARIRHAATLSGLLVLAHANALDMYEKAIQAKVDVIAHGMWNWGEYSRENQIPQPIAAVLDQMVRQGIGYMPTQRVIAGLGEVMLADAKDNPEFPAVTPSEMIDWFGTPAADWFREELRVGFDRLPDQTIADIFIHGRVGKGALVMRYLADAKHPILLGSDFPGSPSFANQPGLATALEMKMMADAGVGLADVLAAATINNAERFGLQAQYGTVEVGKVANLLLLSENPLETIDAWTRISYVILNGVLIERSTLAANHQAGRRLKLGSARVSFSCTRPC